MTDAASQPNRTEAETTNGSRTPTGFRTDPEVLSQRTASCGKPLPSPFDSAQSHYSRIPFGNRSRLGHRVRSIQWASDQDWGAAITRRSAGSRLREPPAAPPPAPGDKGGTLDQSFSTWRSGRTPRLTTETARRTRGWPGKPLTFFYIHENGKRSEFRSCDSKKRAGKDSLRKKRFFHIRKAVS